MIDLERLERLGVEAKKGRNDGTLEEFQERMEARRVYYETIREALPALIAAVREGDALRKFAQAVMRDWYESHLDGAALQDLGVEHGLLESVEAEEPCGPFCGCAEVYVSGEWPVTCFRQTFLLSGNAGAEVRGA